MAPFTRLSSFEDIEEDWQQLLPRCATDTLCLTPHWQKVWWRECGQGAELVLLALRERGGLRGIAPLIRRDKVFSFAGDRDVCDYQDFLVPRGLEAPFYAALLDYLEGEEWEVLSLASIPQSSPTLVHLPALARERGYAVAVSQEDVVPGLALPGSWEEYLGRLTKKDRHELRRKLRRLDSAGEVRCYTSVGSSSLSRDLEDFFALLRGSGEDKHRFLTLQRERFFRTLAQEMAGLGVLKFFFLEINGARVASALCFDYRRARLLYNSGFDPTYSYYSVGLLLKALCLKEAIEEGKEYFDFLRGSEPYKYDLGGEDCLLYQVMVRKR